MRTTITLPTRWGDLNRYRMFQDAVYVDYFQEARIVFFNEAVYGKVVRNDNDRFVVARMRVDYVGERIHAATNVTIDIWPTRLGTKSCVLVSEIHADGELKARAHSVMVGFHMGNHASRVLNETEREVLTALMEPDPGPPFR